MRKIKGFWCLYWELLKISFIYLLIIQIKSLLLNQMFQKALTLDYFVEISYPQSPEPKYEHMKEHIEHIEVSFLRKFCWFY